MFIQNKIYLFIPTLIIILGFGSCTRSNNSSLEASTDIEDTELTAKLINTIMYVTPSNGLNLRSEPNTTSTIITLLPQNTELSVIERGETEEIIDGLQDYWYKVDTGNEIGWVFGGYLSIYNNEFIADISLLNGTWLPDWYNRVGWEHEYEERDFTWGIGISAHYHSVSIDIASEKPFFQRPAVTPSLITKITQDDENSFILFVNQSFDEISHEDAKIIMVSFIDENKILIDAKYIGITFSNDNIEVHPYGGTEVWHRLSGPDYINYQLAKNIGEKPVIAEPVLTQQITPTRTNICECEYMAINAFPQMLVGKTLTFTEIMVIRTQAKQEGLILENGEVTNRQEVASRVFKALDQPIVTLLFGGIPPERAALVGYLLEMSNNNETHFAAGDRDKKPIYSYCNATGTVVSAQEVYVYAD